MLSESHVTHQSLICNLFNLLFSISLIPNEWPTTLIKQILKHSEVNRTDVNVQNVFRKWRSYRDRIFIILQNRLYNKENTFIAYLDVEKAFDNINKA